MLSTTEFQHAFLRERSLVDRRQRPFSLIAFVPAGNDDPRSLPRLARLLRERLRTADVVGRLNADHLAVLLPATDGHGAWVVAESILHRLASAGLKFDCKVYVYPCDVPQNRSAPEKRDDAAPAHRDGDAADTNQGDAGDRADDAASPSPSAETRATSPEAATRREASVERPADLPAEFQTATAVALAPSTTKATRAANARASGATTAPDGVPFSLAAAIEALSEAERPALEQLVAALPDVASARAESAPARPVAPAESAGGTHVTIDRHGDLRSGPYTDAEEGSRELDAIRANSQARPVHDLWPLLVEPLPWWKRTMDVAVSGLLLLLLSPLFLLVAIAIKLDSEGPVIFRQQRAGAGGKPFTFYKFRSMHRDAEARRAALEALNEKDGPIFKIKNDPRLTRVGVFLRKWSIDELPQLFNVLRGDMSLVGPRPPTLNELPGYEAWQRRRLELTGGLTCIWQVSGRSDVSFEEWMRMDLRYARRRTFAQDLKLICKTAGAIWSGRGAY